MTHEERSRMALLEATLREILSIDKTAENDPNKDGSMSYDLALDGPLRQRWRLAKHRATTLLGP